MGPGHFWTSRSSGCGRGAGVQASPERLRLGVCVIWGKVRRDFLGERNASFLLHICLLFFQFATKVIKLPKTWQQGRPESSPQITGKHLPSSPPASRYSRIRNSFNPPLGDETPAPSPCQAAAQPRASGAPARCSTGPGRLEILVSLESSALLNSPNGPGKSCGASEVTAAIRRSHGDVVGMAFFVPKWWGQVAVTQVLLGPPE